MPSLLDLFDEANSLDPASLNGWIKEKMLASAARLGDISGRNVIFYASGFLQKPAASGYLSVVDMEDINGFMACVHGLDYKKDLLLILHTPGGMAEASQSIV